MTKIVRWLQGFGPLTAGMLAQKNLKFHVEGPEDSPEAVWGIRDRSVIYPVLPTDPTPPAALRFAGLLSRLQESVCLMGPSIWVDRAETVLPGYRRQHAVDYDFLVLSPDSQPGQGPGRGPSFPPPGRLREGRGAVFSGRVSSAGQLARLSAGSESAARSRPLAKWTTRGYGSHERPVWCMGTDRWGLYGVGLTATGASTAPDGASARRVGPGGPGLLPVCEKGQPCGVSPVRGSRFWRGRGFSDQLLAAGGWRGGRFATKNALKKQSG